jgi:replicative DNA helicase
MMSVESATNMLARNIVFAPAVAQAVAPQLRALKEHLGGNDAALFLRDIIAMTSGGGITGGDVEAVLDRHPSKVWSRSITLRGIQDSRSAIEHYVDVIREHAMREKLISLNSEVGLALTNHAIPTAAIQQQYLDGLSKVVAIGNGVTNIGSYGQRAMEYVDAILAGHRPGSSVGFGAQLDNYHWYDPGCISTIGGCPGAGKTAAFISSMISVANNGGNALLFSIEMAGYQVCLRAACIICGIPYWKIRRALITTAERDQLDATISDMNNMGLYIDEGVNSIEDIYFKSAARDVKPDIIGIDYAELVLSEETNRRDLEIAKTYTRSKHIAKTLDTHVAVLSQLSRDVDQRPDKWPTMRDLSGTKAAEQASDYIALLLRPQYYFERGLECRVLDSRDISDTCYWMVAKSRNDQVGVVTLEMNAELMRFGELKRDSTANHLTESENNANQDASE